MNLQEIIDNLHLKLLTRENDFYSINVESGYASDLLSCVMTGAKSRGVWITLMSHSNIIAVASLLDLSAIIITENAMPDEDTIAKANHEGIVLLLSIHPTFQIVGQLWEMGLRGT